MGANGPPWRTDTPPRPFRAAVEVRPVAVKYEYIGLMSSPFMTVISGLPMMAQLSPRDCAVHTDDDCTTPAVLMHLLNSVPPLVVLFRNGPKAPLPSRFSSTATYVNCAFMVGLNVA